MADTTTRAAARAAAPPTPEWEKSPAAATLLYLPMSEAAGKFAAEHSAGSILEREQARLFTALAEHVRVLTGGAA